MIFLFPDCLLLALGLAFLGVAVLAFPDVAAVAAFLAFADVAAVAVFLAFADVAAAAAFMTLFVAAMIAYGGEIIVEKLKS